MKVLFICTGNICRSPLAERLLAAAVPGIAAASAGTGARPGEAMDAGASGELRIRGGDPADFAARRLVEEHIAEAGLVLGLTRAHREAAVRLQPAAMQRCFTLREYVRLRGGPRTPPPAPDADDIADPYRRGPIAMRTCADEVAAAVRALAPLLEPVAAVR